MKKLNKTYLRQRPRRLRASAGRRSLVSETFLTPANFVLPLFVTEGQKQKIEISSMPGQARLSPDLLIKQAEKALKLGIPAVALFPQIVEEKKDSVSSEAMNDKGLLPQTVRLLKRELPELVVVTDVAMDPYSSDGHDGVVKKHKDSNGREQIEINNDATLEVLAQMALVQARAGADFVAPSDMMDGRVGFIREILDREGHSQVGIISYTAKYSSGFYGPFRDALNSAPRFGDKKTYQMDPANSREAIRETRLDIAEGADVVMVKPALSYLDVIKTVRAASTVPVAAYNVSGEYSMVKLAAQKNLLDEKRVILEILLSIKRAGADIIFTYHALEAAEWLK